MTRNLHCWQAVLALDRARQYHDRGWGWHAWMMDLLAARHRRYALFAYRGANDSG